MLTTTAEIAACLQWPSMAIPLVVLACAAGLCFRWLLRRASDHYPFAEQMMGLSFLVAFGAGIVGYVVESAPFGLSDATTLGAPGVGWVILCWRAARADVVSG